MAKTKRPQDDDPFAFLDEEESKPEPPEEEEEEERPARTKTKAKKPKQETLKPKKKSSRWPEEVPLLVADDMTWEADMGPGGKRALDWWLYHVFGGLPPKGCMYTEDKVREVLKAVLSERIGKPVKTMWTFQEYAHKHKSPKLAWHAACWNEAMSRLGYEVPQRLRKDPGIK